MDSFKNVLSSAFAANNDNKHISSIRPPVEGDPTATSSSNPISHFLDHTLQAPYRFAQEGYAIGEEHKLPFRRPFGEAKAFQNEKLDPFLSEFRNFEQAWNDTSTPSYPRNLYSRGIPPPFGQPIHSQLEAHVGKFVPPPDVSAWRKDPQAFWSIPQLSPAEGSGLYDNDWVTQFHSNSKTSTRPRNYRGNLMPMPTEDDWATQYHKAQSSILDGPSLKFMDRETDSWVNQFLDNRSDENLNSAYEETFNAAPIPEVPQFKKEEASQLAAYLRDLQDPKLNRSEFLSFIENLAAGKIQFKENKLADAEGKEVEWDNIYAATQKIDPVIVEDTGDFDSAWASTYDAAIEAPSTVLLDGSYDKLDKIWKEARSTGEITEEEYKIFTKAFQEEDTTDALNSAWNGIEADLKSFEDVWTSMPQSTTENGKVEFSTDNPYDSVESPLTLAKHLLSEGKVNEAILACEAEVKQNPESSEGWRLLGQMHADNEQDVDAIACLKKGHEVDPYNLDSLLALGVSLLNELDTQEALLQLKTWIRNHDDFQNIPEVNDIGAPHFDELVNAVRNLFEEAVRLRPDDADAWTALGVICNITRNYELAVHCFSEALQHCPPSSMASLWNKIGATLANFGYSEAALLAYEQTLLLKPNYPRAWANLGVAHANLGFMNKAITYYLTALSLNPKANHLWYYVRVAAMNLGRDDLVSLADRHEIATLKNLLSDRMVEGPDDLPPPVALSRESCNQTLSKLKKMM